MQQTRRKQRTIWFVHLPNRPIPQRSRKRNTLKSNSENIASSARSNSSPVINFHFSNSEPFAVRPSNLAPLTPGFENLPETAERVETRVNLRKESAAHASTRRGLHPCIFTYSPPRQSLPGRSSARTRQTASRVPRTLVASNLANDLYFDSGAIESWQWHVKSAARSPVTAIPSATRTT